MFSRRLVTLLSAGALSVGLSVAAAGSAHAEVIPSASWNEIVTSNAHAFSPTMCIDDPNGSITPGTPLELWHCTGAFTQQWHFDLALVNVGTASRLELFGTFASGNPMCVTFKDISSAGSGLPLVLGSCGFGAAEWEMVTIPGTSTVKFRDDENMCIAAQDFSGIDGTPLVMRTCNPNDWLQNWMLR